MKVSPELEKLEKSINLAFEKYEEKRAQIEEKKSLPLFVSFLGGSGVGKSSLLNLLAGKVLSKVSPRRPTTEEPLVFLPQSTQFNWENYYKGSLRIERYSQEEFPYPLVLMDLPDIDSYQTEHHQLTREILELSQVVLVVLSPDKYGDREVHKFILEAFSKDKKILFLLNKSEDLTEEELLKIKEDFFRLFQIEALKKCDFIPVSVKEKPDETKEIIFSVLKDFIQKKHQILEEELRKKKERMKAKAKEYQKELQEVLERVLEKEKVIEEGYQSVYAEFLCIMDSFFSSGKVKDALRKYIFSSLYPWPLGLFLVLIFYLGVFLKNLFKFIFGWIVKIIHSFRGEDLSQVDVVEEEERFLELLKGAFVKKFFWDRFYNLLLEVYKKWQMVESFNIDFHKWKREKVEKSESYFRALPLKRNGWENKLNSFYKKFILLDWSLFLILVTSGYFLLFVALSFKFYIFVDWYGLINYRASINLPLIATVDFQTMIAILGAIFFLYLLWVGSLFFVGSNFLVKNIFSELSVEFFSTLFSDFYRFYLLLKEKLQDEKEFLEEKIFWIQNKIKSL